MTDERSEPEAGPQAEGGESTEMRCDFCGQVVSSVRRVALDGEYERLRTPHTVQYSCPDCFEKKEQNRQGTGG